VNFEESLLYLLSLGNEVSAMKLGLDNIRILLAALNTPEKNYLKIQIAGTNGKGSTCAFLEAICLSANIKTGMTTSPHLISITERIRINGEEISEEDFARQATLIKKTSEKLVEEKRLETVPTFFEQVTAIALNAFAEAKIELAILETGLGGRFDATTAANAEIIGITPIDFDHERILGNTLVEIAAEKAAIIRADTRVVISSQPKEALDVILEHCRKAKVLPIVNDWQPFPEDSPEISFKTQKKFYPNVRLGLEGEHQNQNACVAISLAEVLIEDFKFDISKKQVIEGLEKTNHKGRLEWWSRNEIEILFDGAHNAAGARALKSYLEKFFAESKITLIFGAMKDKNLFEIAEILFPLAENLILTKSCNPRSAEVEELQKIAEKVIDKSKVFSVADVSVAIDSAKEITSTYSATKHSFICITGSLYLVGEAQKILKSQSKI